MPYVNTWEPGGVYRKFNGLVSSKDFVTSIKSVLGDHRFDTLKYVVIDYLDASEFEFTLFDRMLVRALRIGAFHTNSRIKIAIVTSSETIRQSVQESIDKNETMFQTAVFSSIKEANVWSGRPDATNP